MVEISPDAWKKFFFLVSLEMTLSESQLFTTMRGGGRIFPGGVWGGLGWGKQGFPGMAEPTGLGVRLVVSRSPGDRL